MATIAAQETKSLIAYRMGLPLRQSVSEYGANTGSIKMSFIQTLSQAIRVNWTELQVKYIYYSLSHIKESIQCMKEYVRTVRRTSGSMTYPGRAVMPLNIGSDQGRSELMENRPTLSTGWCGCRATYGGPNGSRTRVTDVRGRCPNH